MKMQLINLLVLVSTFFLLPLSCQQKAIQKPEGSVPDELISDNFAAAELVFLARFNSLLPVDTLFDDRGSPGYIRYRIGTTVQETIKGDIEPDREISYTCVVEHGIELEKDWPVGSLVYVFLKHHPKSGQYIALEFGQLPFSPNVREQLSRLKS